MNETSFLSRSPMEHLPSDSEDRRHDDNLSADQRRAIGRKGGQTVSQNRSHMADIGRKGGASISGNRQHMASIGRKGGQAVSQNREHMANIGRRGGKASSQDRARMSTIGRKGGSTRSHAAAAHEPNPDPSALPNVDAHDPGHLDPHHNASGPAAPPPPPDTHS